MRISALARIRDAAGRSGARLRLSCKCFDRVSFEPVVTRLRWASRRRSTSADSARISARDNWRGGCCAAERRVVAIVGDYTCVEKILSHFIDCCEVKNRAKLLNQLVPFIAAQRLID